MNEIDASRRRLAEAATRRALRELKLGDLVDATGPPDSAGGRVVAIDQDCEGDPLAVLADHHRRRRVVTLDFACRRDATLRMIQERHPLATHQHVDDTSSRRADVDL